jgi:hypothetical protein
MLQLGATGIGGGEEEEEFETAGMKFLRGVANNTREDKTNTKMM